MSRTAPGSPPAQPLDWREEYRRQLRQYVLEGEDRALPELRRTGQAAWASGVALGELLECHERVLSAAVLEAGEERFLAGTDALSCALAPFDAGLREVLATNVKLRYENMMLQQRVAVLTADTTGLAAARDRVAQLERAALLAVADQADLRRQYNQLLALQDDELRQVAQELHPTVCLRLGMVDDILQQLLSAHRAQRHREAVLTARRTIRRAARTVERLARQLYPMMIDQMDLAFGLRWCLNEFESRHGVPGTFQCSGHFDQADRPTRLLLYRIARDTLDAVARKQQATHVEMALRQTNGTLRLDIQDNGIVAKTNATAARKAERQRVYFEERVHLLNGRFAALPTSPHGMVVRVELPLHQRKEAGRG